MTRYKGGVGQWSWIFHRVTGVGVLIFLMLHILDTFLIILGPEHYNQILEIYRHPLFRTMEVGLFAAVLYHGLNGIRIILIDFWEGMARYQRTIFYVEMVLFVAAMIPVSYLMIKPLFH